jgi:limonene-1,2-epoxide hydrolase
MWRRDRRTREYAVGNVPGVNDRSDDVDGEVRVIVRRFLDAVESRDLERVAACLADEVTWQNVPHPVKSGRGDVVGMLDGFVSLCERVEWEIVSAAYEGDTAWLERIDHFWIDGTCHSVCCNGVVAVDRKRGLVLSVRDYVDLGEWRARTRPVLERRAGEPAPATVGRHLDAVRGGDPVAMAADYAAEAVLVRGPESYEGRSAIAAYFRSVPDRLGDGELRFDEPSTGADGRVSVGWALHRPGEPPVRGDDVYEVSGGRIDRQTVTLDDHDF